MIRDFVALDVWQLANNSVVEAHYDQQATMQPAFAILSPLLSVIANSSYVFDPVSTTHAHTTGPAGGRPG